MAKIKKINILFLILAVCCREKYSPQIKSPVTGYLVVEGVINTGIGLTAILLSRTNGVNVDSIRYETGATIQVEGNDNSVYPLAYAGNGYYNSDSLNLSTVQQYRLHIKTHDGEEYISDFEEAKTTPPIDSISWHYENSGVNIFVSTHDSKNNSRYYLWNYEEEWEFHAAYVPTLKFDTVLINGQRVTIVVEAPFDPALYTCWQNARSSNILISSSAKLSEDVINNYPVASVLKGDQKLSVMYSILVKQYSLTADAYEFLQRMRKNTEQTGSVFDPQPSELKGNIHSVSNPAEIVLGYISVCSEQTKRIFIKNSQVPNWDYSSGCRKDTGGIKGTDIAEVVASGYVPVDLIYKEPGSGIIRQFYFTKPECVDCTLTGTNHKPSFWP